MDTQPTSPHRKASLPTFGGGSLPVEVAAVLPASTRSSFTRVDNNTRPGTAAGDNDNGVCDGAAVPSDGALGTPGEGDDDDDEREQAAEAAAVVPQVPQTLVQFLLVSGRRRSMAFDPETTVGRVKELAWNSWPNGTSRPRFTHMPSPSPLFPLFPFSLPFSLTHMRACAAPIVLWKGSALPLVSFLFSHFLFFFFFLAFFSLD